jgi:hypothetical protein
MQPIYLKINNNLPLMVIPDSDAHMDGHPILTYSYAVYKDPQAGKEHRFTNTDALLAPDKTNDPNYVGTLSFEQPGRMFSFAADGQEQLPEGAIQEIIEQLTHYRENPNLWAL